MNPDLSLIGLNYADDLRLLLHRHKGRQQTAEKLSKTASTTGLEVNDKKTKVLSKRVLSNNPVTIKERQLKDVGGGGDYMSSRMTTDCH